MSTCFVREFFSRFWIFAWPLKTKINTQEKLTKDVPQKKGSHTAVPLIKTTILNKVIGVETAELEI